MNKSQLNAMYYKERRDYLESVNKFFEFFPVEKLEFKKSGLKNVTWYFKRKNIIYVKKNLFKIGNIYVNFGLPRIDLPQGKQFIIKGRKIEKII